MPLLCYSTATLLPLYCHFHFAATPLQLYCPSIATLRPLYCATLLPLYLPLYCATPLPLYCYSTAALLPRFCHSTAILLPLYCHSTATLGPLHWHSTATHQQPGTTAAQILPNLPQPRLRGPRCSAKCLQVPLSHSLSAKTTQHAGGGLGKRRGAGVF